MYLKQMEYKINLLNFSIIAFKMSFILYLLHLNLKRLTSEHGRRYLNSNKKEQKVEGEEIGIK